MKNEKLCRSVVDLLAKLIVKRDEYFDKNLYLNSEGMKILMQISRMVFECYPQYRERVRELRRNPSIDLVDKLYRDLYEATTTLSRESTV